MPNSRRLRLMRNREFPHFCAGTTLAAKLGGPYYVDDAEIGKPGSCGMSSWGLFAVNGDHILVFSPACVVNLGVPVELGTNLVGYSPDIGNSIVALTAKTVPIPIGRMGFGLALIRPLSPIAIL